MGLPISSMQKKDFGPQGLGMLAQPMFWRDKALALRRAAELLSDQTLRDDQAIIAQHELVKAGKLPAIDWTQFPPSVSEQYALLAAYAIENLLKARMIGLRGRIEPSTSLANDLISHDLVELARRAEFDLNEEERLVLERLTEASVVTGRYPVPRRSDQVVASSYVNYEALHPVFITLCDRLLALVESKLFVPTRPTESAAPPAG